MKFNAAELQRKIETKNAVIEDQIKLLDDYRKTIRDLEYKNRSLSERLNCKKYDGMGNHELQIFNESLKEEIKHLENQLETCQNR